MNRKDSLDWSVIRKEITGNLTEKDKIKLDNWCRKDFRRKRFLNTVRQYYSQENNHLVEDEQVERAWKRFEISHQHKARKVWFEPWHWCAAVLILLFLGGGIWLYDAFKKTDVEVSLVGNILPGENKARLILSDGRVVPLGNDNQQQLKDRQVMIRTDSTGIIYEAEDNSSELIYHTLQVPHGGEYGITLSDGTIVWMNAGTELTYPVSFSGDERRVKLSGEAYFEVVHNEHQPFIVDAGGVEIKVLGTSFNVNSYPDETGIVTTLVSGRVEVNCGDGSLKVLAPTEQANWDRTTGKITVRQINTFAYTQWREGKFVFRDASLEYIMRTLARWYDMEYEFQLPALRLEKFYGVISRYEQVNKLLDQFEKTGKVHFEYRGKRIIVFK